MTTSAAPHALHIPAFSVTGITLRTCNSDEANPAIARLGGLWNRFFSQSWALQLPGRGDDGRLFGVYSAYESDERGAFDVTAGVAVPPVPADAPAVPGAHRVEIEAGEYLVFEGEGEMPQMVIDTWIRIWRYFAEHGQPVRRRFGTDFEAYEGPDRVAIHIGVFPQN